MPAINADTVDFWKDIAAKLSKQRPYAGRKVKIVAGRKHMGKTGTVVRHMVSRFENPYRYGSEAQHHMIDMAGREWYVCQVRDDSDGSLFWVKAEYTECLDV